MNFQEMDALGGLIEGNKARMTEDSTRINQENVLAQIAKMAQEQQQSAAMHPLKMQELESQNAERASLGKMRDQQMQESQARMTRESAAAYLKDMVTIPMVPGADDALAEQYKIPANHPLRKAAAQARAASQNWDPARGPSPFEQLQERVAGSAPEARAARALAKEQFEKEEMKQREITAREDKKQAAATERARIAADAKVAAQELKNKAAATGRQNLEQYATKRLMEADEAARAGDHERAQQIRAECDAALAKAKELDSIKDDKKRAAEAERLYTLSGGKWDFRQSSTPTTSAAAPAATTSAAKTPAAPPNQDAIKKALGKNYDPNKQYEVGADGTVYELRPKQ